MRYREETPQDKIPIYQESIFGKGRTGCPNKLDFIKKREAMVIKEYDKPHSYISHANIIRT